MTFDQKQKTALFRYSVIAPLETGISDPSISNNEFFRRAAAKTYTDPDGKTVTIGASTIEKWHRAYKKGGIALIDDASRFIVAADLFFNDSFENLMTVIRSAVSKFGRPGLFTFDNGSSYRNNQMELLAARIGSSVHYCEPFTPTGKSKIERWFLTVRLQYLASLDMRNFHSLEDLRRDFAGYVSRYNQTPHSSLGGKTPQERYFSEPERFRRLPENQIEKDFLLETERRVSADNVIVINRTEYEVHYRYAKQRIRLSDGGEE
ncbi:MAG: DDE-type integrase/transposase/recombinase [Blautia sp.]|nr:DDE-type integrase/transposase/recombinase [Blautia sp.]